MFLSFIQHTAIPATLAFFPMTFFSPLYYEPAAVAKTVYLICAHHLNGLFQYRGSNPISLNESDMDKTIIICLHGDQSDPATFVPLIDRLKENPLTSSLPLYAPHFKNELEDGTSYLDQLQSLISSISEQCAAQGKQAKILFVGHSAGGIAASYYTYCLPHPSNIDILGTVAISSRLTDNGSCPEKLAPILHAIENGYSEKSAHTPLYTIFGDQDWLVPEESLQSAMATEAHIVPGQSHISTLYDKETLDFTQSIIINQSFA